MTYESAKGEQIEADVLDLASGGVFIRTDAPLSVGKRIAVDLTVIGEAAPWSALGRVVWVRATAEPGRPAGMGVKLIDMDDATLQAIERLVETREPTAPGVGKGAPVVGNVSPVGAAPVIEGAPGRERTLMGVGMGSEPPPPNPPPPAPDQPTVVVKASEPPPPQPARASSPPREQSVAIDLLAVKRLPPKSVPPPAPAPVDSGGGPGRWVVILLLLAVAGIAAYVLIDGFLRPLGK